MHHFSMHYLSYNGASPVDDGASFVKEGSMNLIVILLVASLRLNINPNRLIFFKTHSGLSKAKDQLVAAFFAC